MWLELVDNYFIIFFLFQTLKGSGEHDHEHDQNSCCTAVCFVLLNLTELSLHTCFFFFFFLHSVHLCSFLASHKVSYVRKIKSHKVSYLRKIKYLFNNSGNGKCHISTRLKGKCYYQTLGQFFLTDPRTSSGMRISDNSGLSQLIRRNLGRCYITFHSATSRFLDIVHWLDIGGETCG